VLLRVSKRKGILVFSQVVFAIYALMIFRIVEIGV